MGEVYRARDSRLGRDVAVKVLSTDAAASPERRSRFEKEARAASALNHPNIVSIYDIGEAGEITYIAMELVDGATLRDCSRRARFRRRRSSTSPARSPTGSRKPTPPESFTGT